MRTRVKICGFTRVEDAVDAVDAGADAIGLVFYRKSPRYVEIEKAAAIVKALPAFVSVIALVANEDDRRIREIIKRIDPDCLQFHGNEASDVCRRYGKRYLKAIAMRPGLDVLKLADDYRDASALLLDAFDPDMKGGTGQVFNWTQVPAVCPLPIVLAGGLNEGNIEAAIGRVRPFAVDVSSGVEKAKGIKDKIKMMTFINRVSEADRLL